MTDLRRLPVPVTSVWDWQMRAACRDLDSEVFFHPAHERGPAAAARDAVAKSVCAACPVIDPCRVHALGTHEPYGIWGGLTAAERAAMLRRRVLEPAPEPVPEHPHADSGDSPDLSTVADGNGRAEVTCTVDTLPVAGGGSGTITVLRLVGEIDLTTQTLVDAVLAGGLQTVSHHLLVDLSGVAFCGVRGFTGFAATAQEAAGRGVGFALCGPSPHLGRVASTMWGPGQITLYDTVDGALTAIRAHAARPA